MSTYDAIVLGTTSVAPSVAPLRRAGIGTVLMLPNTATTGGFDEATHTWSLSYGGRTHQARVVIADTPVPQVDGMVPYLGVAVHGLPNFFLIPEPPATAQLRYIAECLKVMARGGSTRIEVRYSTQRVFNDHGGAVTKSSASQWRRMRRLVESAFDFGSQGGDGLEDDVYDGPATLRVGAADHPVRTRLTGHLDPIDGRFHWQGTVFADLQPIRLPQRVELTVAERSAEARLTERTPWGGYSVAGVGAPPFALPPVELMTIP